MWIFIFYTCFYYVHVSLYGKVAWVAGTHIYSEVRERRLPLQVSPLCFQTLLLTKSETHHFRGQASSWHLPVSVPNTGVTHSTATCLAWIRMVGIWTQGFLLAQQWLPSCCCFCGTEDWSHELEDWSHELVCATLLSILLVPWNTPGSHLFCFVLFYFYWNIFGYI